MRTAMKLAGLGLLMISLASLCPAYDAPEIDPATGLNALTLLGGVVVLVRSRRK
jgi:hypothetical protein